MKAPAFWSNPPDRPGWQARLLAPFSALWQAGSAWRARRIEPSKAGAPVLCIGNLTAGGAGKTPLVAALMERLSAQGLSAHVVSRGYGGTEKGPHLVDPTEDSADRVGDEPLMLAARGLVWVAKDRAAGAAAAVDAKARLIVLDDGYQNPSLAKDASILVVDAGAGFGNGRLIPAGPLREAVAEGLSRADLVVLIGPEAQREAVLRTWPELLSVQTVGAELKPLRTGLPLADVDVIAFAGIGRPEKFFQTLRDMGANVIGSHPFPDHHPYSPTIVRRMIQEARQRSAALVTTEKDAVRLPEDLRAEVLTLQITFEPDDWAPIDQIIQRITGGLP